jgi:hypothetical protein
MKTSYILSTLLIFKGFLLIASPLNIDPQKEDMNLQNEQTRDIQFQEDQSFKQEREIGR